MKKFLKFLMWSGVAILNAILVWFTFMLFALGNYSLAVTLGVFVAIADWAIFSKKGYPYRYTIAALFFLFVLTIYPMYYTIQIAFTMITLILSVLFVLAKAGQYSLVEMIFMVFVLYGFIQWVVINQFRKITVHRGMFHSIPVAFLFGIVVVYCCKYI